MRLLLRRGSHRPVSDDGRDGVEVAASPDTPGRRPKLWQVRLLVRPPDLQAGRPPPAATVNLIGPGPGVLVVHADPHLVSADAEARTIGRQESLDRDAADLTVLVVDHGNCVLEDRHTLGPRDVMILEGDDPLEATIRADEQTATVVVVVLRATDGGQLAWVP